MNKISVLPRHNAISLSKDFSFERLQGHKQQQIFPQPHTTPLKERLLETYTEEAALVQYVLTRTDDDSILPITPRLKEESLYVLNPTEMYISMRWVILDWDLKSKGVIWGDSSKPETKEQLKEYIAKHPKLSQAYAYYFSKSGIRVMYSLENPLKLLTSNDVLVWKTFFREFVGSIDINEIGGELELKADPFTLNRVPCYTKSDGLVVKGEVVFLKTDSRITVEYPSHTKGKPKTETKKFNYGQLPHETVAHCLFHDEFITYLRTSQDSLHYQDWRALGTNIAALLGENGFAIFDEISSWDTNNYDPQAVGNAWISILRSAEDYGPVTWTHYQFDLSQVYRHFNPNSSLAAKVRRKVKDIQVGTSAHPNPGPNNANAGANVNSQPADNTQEVYGLLETTTVGKGQNAITKASKTPTNLLTILTEDNRWKNKIRRNHLGSIDMIGTKSVQDEHITMIRETVSRVYGLLYTKDDVWDFIKLIAQKNEFHPVADYFKKLTWDGTSRIADFAKSIGQVDPFAEVLLRKFLVSCVVRPLEWANHSKTVNWKIDTVLILKGSQGKRKSSFFKALCSDEDWFSDNLPSITVERKDASLHMLGKWIVEQAEFEGHVARSSVEMMKAFITREREIFRKPYGRAEINMRRPSVLVGTTNSSNFLNDPTGDRRFWVLEIPESHKIDVAWVRLNREQLWAEAITLYKQGVEWWLTDPETKESNLQNSKFRRPDALWEAVIEFLQTNPTMAGIRSHADYEDGSGFTLNQLVSTGLDKKLADIKSYEAQAIVSHLTKLGFVKTRVRVNKQRTYIYRKLKDFDDDAVI